MTDTQNTKSSETTLTAFQKNILSLSEKYKSIDETRFTKSGSVAFDAVLGGGIPEGSFILLSAENGCGKSTLALSTSWAFTLQGKKVLYLDIEGGVNMSQLSGIGLTQQLYHPTNNPNGTFYLFQARTYREVENILDLLMEDVDLVVIDSITAILTTKLSESSSEDALPGLDARVCSLFLKKYRANAVRSGTSWIIINQIRTRISFGFGSGDEEAGGNALKFTVDARLWMTKKYGGKLVRKEETATNGLQEIQFGQLCDLSAKKNRYERPGIALTLAVIFGRGISNSYSYLEFLMSSGGIIKGSGGFYTITFLPEPKKIRGLPNVIEWIDQNRKLVKKEIDDKGGYRLLLNKAGSVDLTDSASTELYDDRSLDGAYDAISLEEENPPKPSSNEES